MKYPLLLLAGLLLLPGSGQADRKNMIRRPPVLSADALKIITTGIYQDAAGSVHSWHITPEHILDWDNMPYLPVGGAFMPHYWIEAQTDAAWDADKQALDTLKAHGVHDLYLYAGEKGLTHIPPIAVQRVLDYLDAHDFRYGIEIADFPKDPLVGYVIKPSVYRDPAPPAAGSVRFSHVAGLATAFYILASPHDANVPESGDAQIIDHETALVTLKAANPGDVLLLYPQRLFFTGTPESHLPDLWQGYDEYRDRLLSFFHHVKLGPGFRFFLDPLTDKIAMNGEVENLVPTTDGFRLDFEAWLGRKYGHDVDDLNGAWGIAQRDVPDFATAARCIPLWFQNRGLPAIYDPLNRVQFQVVNKPHIAGHFWDDLRQFRLESTRGYMNAIADVLKKGVADVPVIYKWSGYSPLFSNDQDQRGYDGLGMEAFGHGRALSVGSGAYTFAQAEEAPRTSWLIVSDTQETLPSEDKTKPGYASKATLFNDWDYLKEIGARGFFTQALQRLPADLYVSINLLGQPEQLDWLSAYAGSLQTAAPTLHAPHVLWYPANAAGSLGLEVRRLTNGAWWLPWERQGDSVAFSPSLQAYTLPNPDGLPPTYVVWSPDGAESEAQFPFAKGTMPSVTDSLGTPLKVTKKNDVWTVPVGRDPILISHVTSLPLPQNVVEATHAEIVRLIKLADSQKIPTQHYKDQLFYADNSLSDKPGIVSGRNILQQTILAELSNVLQPYAWLEGENAAKYTFDSLVPETQASGGAYLLLDTDRDPPAASAEDEGGYRAEYNFAVNAPGRYTLWMAGSALEGKDFSPFTYQVDEGALNDVRGIPAEGYQYAGKFAWSNLGDVTLQRGPHMLKIVVTGRRPSDKRYALAIDAFCLDRAPFHPDGPRQPPIDTSAVPDVPAATDKNHK